MKKTIAPFLIIMALIKWCHGQEIVLPLEVNPVKSNSEIQIRSTDKDIPLSLPFHDDFSYPGPYPDPLLWSDNYVFVNSYFAKHPKTVGVATFDALDQYGYIYSDAQADNNSFVADHLTSNIIRLDSVFEPSAAALNPADSVLLTFYYQPQGIGGDPTHRDSLVVEFLHTPGYFQIDDNGEEQWIDDLWMQVWGTTGKTLQEFSGDTFPYFRRVAIPIDDEVYFRDDFRLRFRNTSHFPVQKTPVNYTGNNHIWNVDYVTLDRGRSINNLGYYDIAFAAPATSLLQLYTAMPWSHYIANPQAHLRDKFVNYITNLGNITYNYTYQYVIKDETNTNIRTHSGGTWNIAPFHQSGYQNHAPHTNPNVLANPLPTSPAPERTFRIVHSIREGATGDQNRRNDTISFTQHFKDYFAYDNGVPQGAYGIKGYGQPRAAVQFEAYHQDYLKEVNFFFVRHLHDQNVKQFYLTVWSSLDPEEIIYQSELLTPEFEDGLNQFVTYQLEEPLQVNGSFYVGWQQTGNDDFMGIGIDLVNDASARTFVKPEGIWMPSIMQGALMIRPVMVSSGPTSINKPDQTLPLAIYPNPVTQNILNIRLNDNFLHNQEYLMLSIYDMQGRVVHSQNFSNTVSTAHLPNGLYFLKLTNPSTGNAESVRFLISR